MSGDYEIVRFSEIPWESRVNVDGWPNRAGLYLDDRENALCMRFIDYPVGSTEPRHVHAGSHATTVLNGRAIIDGVTLGPLDAVLGPSNEPHGPLHYPDGCQLFSVFHGSYYHSEVENLSTEQSYRLIQSARIPWETSPQKTCEVKTLVDRGVGRAVVQALHFPPGARFQHPDGGALHAALMVEGAGELAGGAIGRWDFIRFGKGGEASTLSFPRGATLLTVTLR